MKAIDKAIKACDASFSEKAEYLNKKIKYWQDLVYYYTDKGETDKAKVAKKQLEGYKKAYNSLQRY